MFSVNSGECRSYSFNITKQGGNYEIRMNETVGGIKLWFLPDGADCLLSVLYSAGACRITVDTVFILKVVHLQIHTTPLKNKSFHND